MQLLLLLLASALAAQPTKRPSDDERGRELYDKLCMACHGLRNHGDGPATEALVHDVPDLAGKVEANDETIKVLMRGQGAMPSYEPTLDRHDARLVLRWMAKVHTEADKPKPKPKPNDDPAEPDDDGNAPEDAEDAEDAEDVPAEPTETDPDDEAPSP